MTAKHEANHANSTFNDIKDTLGHKYEAAKDNVSHLARHASEKAAHAKEYIVEKSHVIKAKAVKAEESVSGYVKENPWKAVGISAAVGLVLGKLLRRRK